MSAREMIVGIGLVISLGCVPHTEEPPATTAAADTPAATPGESAPSAPAGNPGESASVTEPATPPESSTPSSPVSQPAESTPPQPPTQLVEAEAGVGKQGQSLKNDTGVLVEAAKALFQFRQKAVFEIQIPDALNKFQGIEGRKPNSHDEFMKIIKANGIQLPTLPANQRYIYDVERGELMVERPAR